MGKLWEFLRKLPIAKWIKPLWKGAIRSLIQKQGDKLQEELKAKVAAEGPAAVDKVIDRWQLGITAGLAGLHLPLGIGDQVIALVQEKGDSLQEDLAKALKERGPQAIDAIFDAAQAALLAKVAEL